MGKAATPKKRTTDYKDVDPAVDYLAALQAKQRFVGTVLNMGWRLAIGFIIPVLIGAWLDRRYNTSPSYTLAGIFIGVFAGVSVVRSTVKEVNAEMAEIDAEEASSKPKKRSKK